MLTRLKIDNNYAFGRSVYEALLRKALFSLLAHSLFCVMSENIAVVIRSYTARDRLITFSIDFEEN